MKIGWGAWEPEPHFPVDRIRPIVHDDDEHNDGDDDGKKKHFKCHQKKQRHQKLLCWSTICYKEPHFRHGLKKTKKSIYFSKETDTFSRQPFVTILKASESNGIADSSLLNSEGGPFKHPLRTLWGLNNDPWAPLKDVWGPLWTFEEPLMTL